jgi:ubiquinone/menaquinone biosynthesis C-methylase UbiE
MTDASRLAGNYQHRAEQTAVLQRQFRLPRGLMGRLVGWLMARSNRDMNRIAVNVLAAKPNDEMLEIGFGPGHAIELLVKRTAAKFIAGVDPSGEMVEQAKSRNQDAVDAGRVTLLQSTADELPFSADRFSKVFAVNNFLIWDAPDRCLGEIRRVLRNKGRLVICLRRAPRTPRWWKSPGATADELKAIRGLLTAAMFCNVRLVERRLKRRIVCLVAEK